MLSTVIGLAQFGFSRNGSLVHVPGNTKVVFTLVCVDRQGAVEPLSAPSRHYRN